MKRVLSAATNRLDPIDGFIDAVMAWENCFGTASETTFRVTASLSALLEPEDDLDRLGHYSGAARNILISVAQAGTTITYGSLAERIAEDTGIEERRPLYWWIGNVLGEIARVNHERNEPFLSSLVVSASNGQVGEGYLIPVRDLLDEHPEDGEEHAALQRVRCYRFFTANAH